MAKQKKRKKRVQKPRLSKKDRGLYALVFFPCIIVVLLSLQSVTRFSVFLLRMLYGTETLYAELDFGAWLVLALISFFVFGISGVIMHEYAISLRIPFREYFGGKNEKAKKQRKKFLLSFVVLALMTVGLFYASAQSCVIASPEAVTHYRCTEPDEVLFDYDKVDSVHISLEERNFRMVGGFVVSRHGYDLVLQVSDGADTYEFAEDGFAGDYARIETFLDKIPNAEITKDTTFLEKALERNNKNKDALERIFAK